MSSITTQNLPFHPAVASWFTSQFSEPSPPQVRGWPVIAASKHALILAPTGSGKTLAAFLWCIDEIFRSGLESSEKTFARNPSGVHTLYISPLKALNNDIHRNLQEPLKGIRVQARKLGWPPPEIRTLVRTSDTPPHIRQSMLKRPPHILITTPESLYLLLTSERGREIFRGLRYLIVDEIHAMAKNKRGVHLSLSLERLMTLCQQEPVRIGLSATQRPLERIAAFLGGQKFNDKTGQFEPRPVAIVDCGLRKDLDVQVISPVENFSDLPDATVWPMVIEQLYQLICDHRTTLVFVNMRAQTERVARMLNELHQKTTGNPEVQLALAHHGSISREVRYDIEARLKAGEIPAVIATASLELGIDIGSIDLVVQLESPRSVTDALQRVGRSGHLLRATSKGRVIPMYPSDLDDAVALTQCIQGGEIEETVIPENCLDVLAQQIVAEVAMRDWPREVLYRLVHQSYCYRNLSPEMFNYVVEMLAGRFADAPLRALQPRISWDKVNDRLIARKGARLLAAMNGGTIPDRGYYSVYLADTNTKLGEMEEEFVFESRVGNVFFLGNHEWRIDAIQQDRIIVSPVHAATPRAPFWKGDTLYREFATSQKIGAFRRELLESDHGQADHLPADPVAASNLLNYLQRQREHTGKVATDQQIVGEWFRDSNNEPHLILHTCFGARVNGLWAIALAAALEKRYHVQVQYSYDDDGVILRPLDTTEPLPVEELLRMSGDEVERLLLDILIDTPMFAVRFRYNAARALILPRSQPNKRIPLWLSRLRAADLLQVARQYPDFPVIIETYRDCLQDLFDLTSLRKVMDDLQRSEIKVHITQTPFPSPMASGLMFDFLSSYLYEKDRSRVSGQVAAVSSELLAEVLSQEKIPTIVTRAIVEQAEARWQNRAPEFQAANVEDLFAIIAKLAPISENDLAERSKADPKLWLQQLKLEKRILLKKGEPAGWMPAEDSGLFEEPTTKEKIRERIRRCLRIHGPLTVEQIEQKLNLAAELIQPALRELAVEKEVVRGQLVVEIESEQWCDRHNFAELYRRAITVRRQITAPASREQFYRFLLRWHQVAMPGQSLIELVKRYAGFRFPISVFEREILRSRWCSQNIETLPEVMNEFFELIARGEVIPTAVREGEEARIGLTFMQRGSGHVFTRNSEKLEVAQHLEKPTQTVFDFLKENGASLARDIVAGTALAPARVRDALSTLARSGLASCENYGAFLSTLQEDSASPGSEETGSWLPAPPPAWTRHGRNRSRQAIRNRVQQNVQLSDSRWFLSTSFAVMGKELTDNERAERQARLLLARYGILAKEWYRREQGLLPWYQLFQMLKRLEWQGEVRRGYFIEGLSGVQFALSDAVELLEKIQTQKQEAVSQPVLISAVDPALPLGGTVDWDLHDMHGNKVTVVRSPSNHFVFIDEKPIFYSENYGSRVWRLAKIPDDALDECAKLFKTWLQLPAHLRPRKRIEIIQINDQPAATCKLAEVFVYNGFERDGDKLVLWPSGV